MTDHSPIGHSGHPTAYAGIDPLLTLVKLLRPKYPVPQPELPVEFRPPCEGAPSLFFSNHAGELAKAKALCSDCPLKQWCVDFATRNEEYGIWGGTGFRDRQRAPGRV